VDTRDNGASTKRRKIRSERGGREGKGKGIWILHVRERREKGIGRRRREVAHTSESTFF
jgi:hypothetical protein